LIEQYQPEETRLFSDPLVKGMVGAPIRVLMQSARMRNLTMQQMDAITPGIYGVQISRTRFIDDAVQDAFSRGIGQVVILGAGLDTRPYRLAGIERAKVFEVDLPSVQGEKKKKLQKHFGRLPAHVTFLPIDFDTQSRRCIIPGAISSLPASRRWERRLSSELLQTAGTQARGVRDRADRSSDRYESRVGGEENTWYAPSMKRPTLRGATPFSTRQGVP
jgi:hypothetical protein